MGSLDRERLTLSTTHWMFHPLECCWESQAALGVRSVELHMQEPHVSADEVSGVDVGRLAKAAERAGVRIVALTPECAFYPYTLGCADPAGRERSRAFLELAIAATAELGASVMLLSPSGDVLDEDGARARARVSSMLSDLAPLAEEAGVTLAVRTAPGESAVAADLHGLVDLLDEVASPAVAACLDLCSMGLAGETPGQWLEALGDRVAYVRLSDGRPAGHLAWGDGLFPKARYLEWLERGGYRGVYAVEVDDFDRYPEPWLADRQTISALGPLFQFDDIATVEREVRA